MTLVRRIARPLVSAIFVVQGVDTLRHPSGRAAKAAPFLDKVAGPLNLPADNELLVRASGATMVGAGALFATGHFPRLSSLALTATLLPTTVAGHPFWEESDPQTKKAQQIQFLKNLSMLGGLMLAVVDTEGKPGIAYRAKLARKDAGRATRVGRREAKHAAKTAKREARLAAAQAKDALT